MNSELQNLLARWREGSLTAAEMETLTALLAKPEARAALRRDWFLDAALPQALAASSVIVRTPLPKASSHREEEATVVALRLWSRASIAALALALITTSWLIWPHLQKNADDLHSDPASIAQLMLETQLSDSP